MTPDKPCGAIHAPALPEGSDGGLETSELVSAWLLPLPDPACEGSTLERASCINHAHRSPTFRPCFQGSPPGTLAHLGITASVSLPLFAKYVQGKVVTLQLPFKILV